MNNLFVFNHKGLKHNINDEKKIKITNKLDNLIYKPSKNITSFNYDFMNVKKYKNVSNNYLSNTNISDIDTIKIYNFNDEYDKNEKNEKKELYIDNIYLNIYHSLYKDENYDNIYDKIDILNNIYKKFVNKKKKLKNEYNVKNMEYVLNIIKEKIETLVNSEQDYNNYFIKEN